MACGKNFRAYLVGGFSAIGGFLFGYHTGVISGVLIMPDFKNKMNIRNITSDDTCSEKNYDPTIGGIVGILLFGCFLGSLTGGQTSDRFSRKYSISAFSLLFTISAALQTFPKDLVMLLIGRFFAGVSIGALSMIVPLYHSEIASTRVRGRIITFQQWAITIGIGISFWINVATRTFYDDTDSRQWRIPLGLQMIPSIILSIGIIFCPFSPRWLIFHDREDEAREVLLRIRSVSHDEIEEEMERIKTEVAYLRENEIDSYRQLFRVPLRRPFMLGVGIQILQQLTGINATTYYAPQIFARYVSSNARYIFWGPLTATGVYGILNILFTIPTMIFIDKVGRRRLLISGAIIMFISLLTVTILTGVDEKHYSVLIIVFIYIFIAGFAFSWGPIPWVYCAEIFPLTMRAKATSITTAANWATNCAISFLVSVGLTCTSYITFLPFAILCAIMAGIILLFYPETKNKHLEESYMMDSKRIFVHQKLEDKRRNCNTLSDRLVAKQTLDPISSEQNSVNQSTSVNYLNPTVANDDDFLPKQF